MVSDLNITAFGLANFAGFLLSISILYLRARTFKMSPEKLMWLSLSVVVGGAIGARFLYLMVFERPIREILSIVAEPGHMFFGFLFGGTLAFLMACKWLGLPLVSTVSVCLPPWSVAQIFGRIGCLLSGCCFGRPCDSRLAIKSATLSRETGHVVYVHPTQLYEAGLSLLITYLLFKVSAIRGWSKFTLPIYLLMYSTMRLFVDFLRYEDSPSFVMGFSPSQVCALIVIVVSVALAFFINRYYSE